MGRDATRKHDGRLYIRKHQSKDSLSNLRGQEKPSGKTGGFFCWGMYSFFMKKECLLREKAGNEKKRKKISKNCENCHSAVIMCMLKWVYTMKKRRKQGIFIKKNEGNPDKDWY